MYVSKLREKISYYQMTILIGFYFFSLPIGRTLWLPLLIMAVIGIIFFIRDFKHKDFPTTSRIFFIVAACFYIPGLLSLPDSWVISRTLKYLGLYPLFVMVGYFILTRLKQGEPLLLLLHLVAGISLFWSGCAFWQFLLPEVSPFPEPVGGRYQGIFQSHMVLGYMLASVLPFLTLGYWHYKRPIISMLLGVILIGACLISGNRASWISIMVFLFALAAIAIFMGYRPRLKSALIFGVIGSLILVFYISLISGSEIEKRISYTLKFFENPSFETFEDSSASRGEIWLTAIKIGIDNPFNGIGVSNFRYAHPYYVSDNNLSRSVISSSHQYTGAMYAHQMVLQQFAGAGVPGLLGILLFYGILASLSFQAVKQKNILAIAAALAVWVGFFPLNTHLNFHGSWLIANFWVWCGVLFGVIARKEEGV